MSPWEQRPAEVANLFNPAFCGEVLRLAIAEYGRTRSQPLPFALTFLVLPVVLHRRTRESINPRGRQTLHVWLQGHQELRVGFAERTRQMLPITNESLSFLLQLRVVSVEADGGIQAVSRFRPNAVDVGDGEVADCFQKAPLVGRWFARAGTPANIYTMWGVKP